MRTTRSTRSNRSSTPGKTLGKNPGRTTTKTSSKARRLAIGGAASLTTGLLASSLLGTGLAAAAPTQAGLHHTVGYVYVNDNTAGGNTISAFDRHADGSLAPLPGSPFPAGGAGLGKGLGSQGAVEVTSDGRFLLAVDAGSNQLSVLRITGDGALQPVAGSPVASGGVEPVSVAVSAPDRSLVYVANGGSGGVANYSGFTLDRGGHLQALPQSTVTLPAGSQPGDVLFSGDGTHVAGTRVGTGLVDSFNVSAAGQLSPAAGSPYPSQGPGPIGAEFRPTDPRQLFVSNAHGGAGNGTVSAFRVAPDARLTSIGAGPFADQQTAPCWVEISPDGHFLFAVNTAVPSISRYSIAPNGSLTLLGSTQLNATTEAGPVDARLTPDGGTLYVTDGSAQAVSAFAVNGGDLDALAASPTALPTGTSPVGIVVTSAR